MSVERDFGAIDVSGPTPGNQVRLAKLNAGQAVVATKTKSRISEFFFQGSLGHAIVRIHEAVRAVCGAKHLHGMTIGARPRIVDDARCNELFTRKWIARPEPAKPCRRILALLAQAIVQSHTASLDDLTVTSRSVERETWRTRAASRWIVSAPLWTAAPAHDGVAQLDNMSAIMILASGSGAISTDSTGAHWPLLAISGIDARCPRN